MGTNQTPYVLTLELQGLPKRINQLSGAHWRVRHAETTRWHKRVLGRMMLSRAPPPPRPLERAKIRFIRYSSRAPDFDGLVHSFKPVLDALRKCLVIKDDSMEVIGQPEYEWRKTTPRDGRIEIFVEEIKD